MDISALTLIITLAGIVFFLICLLIIILGKKIDSDEARPQMIKVGQYFEVNGNSIILLTCISAFLIIAPLALYYWKRNYIDMEQIEKQYIKKDNLTLDLYIPLLLEDGRSADSVNVQLITIKDNDTTIKNVPGYVNNYYNLLTKIEPEVDYTLNFVRKGSPVNKFHYKFNRVTSPVTLIKK